MAQSISTKKSRSRKDVGYSSPPPDAQISTAAIGTPTTQLALAFSAPMMIVGSAVPTGITVGTLAPTSIVSVGPNGVTLGFASTLSTGSTLNVLSSIPNFRTPTG